MKKILILSVIFLTTNLLLFGQTEGWNTIEKDSYSIDYPMDWQLNESGQMGTSFILFSPFTSENDKFRENINFLVQDLTGYKLDLDAYVEISEGQIKTMMANGSVIESRRLSNQSFNYHKLIYNGKQGNFNLKFEQYIWVMGDKASLLTLTCEEIQFDNYKLKGEKILNSFKFNR